MTIEELREKADKYIAQAEKFRSSTAGATYAVLALLYELRLSRQKEVKIEDKSDTKTESFSPEP